MDRETLLNALDGAPIRVHMNDGSSFVFPDHRSVFVVDTTA
jgi:hypothetical protein